MNALEAVDRILRGDIAAGARVIRWFEDGDARGLSALTELYPKTGRAHVIGLTGPAGVGKSSVADMLIAAFRGAGAKVGVVAVDPSSPFSGGAVLGDRVRMHRHASDPGVFIRSMSARGQLGGLARTTFDAALVLDAMGYDPVLIETVGVGQDEIEIAGLAHSTIVLFAPGLGDEVQALKAGLMEVGDVVALNKMDRDGAHNALSQLELALHLRHQGLEDGAWRPPALGLCAVRDEGGDILFETVQSHLAHLKLSGAFDRRSSDRAYEIFRKLIGDGASARLVEAAPVHNETARLIEAVRRRELHPAAAAQAALDAMFTSKLESR